MLSSDWRPMPPNAFTASSRSMQPPVAASPAGSVAPGVDDMARPCPRGNDHYIEPQAETSKRVVPLQKQLGRPPDAATRLGRHRAQRQCGIAAPLHLDKGDHLAAPRDEVDLADSGAVAA